MYFYIFQHLAYSFPFSHCEWLSILDKIELRYKNIKFNFHFKILSQACATPGRSASDQCIYKVYI